MGTPPPTNATRRPLATWRGVGFAIGLGLVLGTLISVAVVRMLPVPTGIASVKLIELADDGAAGHSWALELEVDRSGYPFLIHVDRDGHPSLLFPDGRITQFVAGEHHRLPDDTGARAWRSPDGAVGGEIFVTLSGTPYLELDKVISRAERAALEASSSAEARRIVRKVLRSQLGPGVIVKLPDKP